MNHTASGVLGNDPALVLVHLKSGSGLEEREITNNILIREVSVVNNKRKPRQI